MQVCLLLLATFYVFLFGCHNSPVSSSHPFHSHIFMNCRFSNTFFFHPFLSLPLGHVLTFQKFCMVCAIHLNYLLPAYSLCVHVLNHLCTINNASSSELVLILHTPPSIINFLHIFRLSLIHI